jgi:hypothetical protein
VVNISRSIYFGFHLLAFFLSIILGLTDLNDDTKKNRNQSS